MRIMPPFEEKIREQIRDELAKKPMLTMVALKERLEKEFDRDFHHSYIRKLVGKVVGQSRYEIDHAKIGPRLISLRETHRIARERLLKIVCWEPDPNDPAAKPPGHLTVVEAAKNLVMLDIAVLNAEVANGLYKNIDEASNGLRYPALPDESRVHIASAFEKWGMLPPATVHQIVERQTTTLHAERVITTS